MPCLKDGAKVFGAAHTALKNRIILISLMQGGTRYFAYPKHLDKKDTNILFDRSLRIIAAWAPWLGFTTWGIAIRIRSMRHRSYFKFLFFWHTKGLVLRAQRLNKYQQYKLSTFF